MYKLPEGVDYSYKAGVPGLYNEKGELVKKAEDMSAQELSTYEADYRRRRGEAQIKVDQQVNAILKQEQEARRNSQPVKPDPEPSKPKPKPAPAIPAKSDDGTGYTLSPPGSQARKDLEAQIAAANEARRKAEASSSTDRESPRPVKSARQLELDKINADKTLTPEKKWEITNPGLAAARRERKAIRGTSETDNPLMQGLRSKLPAAKTALDTTAFKADLAKSGIKPSAYSSLLNNPRRMRYQQPSVEKEAYDVVLDYLLSEGHAETIEEAHYVMMQLDSEYIQRIVEN